MEENIGGPVRMVGETGTDCVCRGNTSFRLNSSGWLTSTKRGTISPPSSLYKAIVKVEIYNLQLENTTNSAKNLLKDEQVNAMIASHDDLLDFIMSQAAQ